VAQGGLLHAAADLVNHRVGQPDGVEVVHHYGGMAKQGDQRTGVLSPGIEGDRPDPGQPASGSGTKPALHRSPGAVGPIRLGGLREQLGDLGLEVGVGAVGRRGGVGLDLGAIQGEQPEAHHAGGRAQLQRLDQQPSQGLFVADPEPGDRHMVGSAIAGQHAEGDVLGAAPLDLAGGADPGTVAIQQHRQQHPGW
jgi:hypothetical protein